MINNTYNKKKNVVICGLCGFIMAITLNGFVCTNPQCPEYVCERHEHIPEKGDTGTNGYINSSITVSGTATSVTTSTIYPYSNLVNLNKGGDVDV